jgi:hypothetical protein
MLTRDGFGLTGGPAPVTLPTAPVATLPSPPPPSPPLPSPPTPVLPTPGIETADAFQFDEVFLGNPGSAAEAFELLGFVPWEAPPDRFPDLPGGGGGAFIGDAQPWVDVILMCTTDPHGNLDCVFW